MENPGRNDPCPCGSGKKYKKCCIDKLDGRPSAPVAPSKNSEPTQAEINQLVGHFNTGNHAALESLASALLNKYPASGFIWKALGTSLQLQGKDGLNAIQKAAELLPEDAEIHYNLGITLKNQERFEDAVTSFRRALKLRPDYIKALCNMGESLRRLGKFDEAIASHTRALEIKPDYAEAHNNLGIVLKDLWRLNEAVASYCRALMITPDVPEILCNLGSALKDLGKFDDAAASYCKALEIKPGYEEAYCYLGNVLRESGKTEEAIKCYRNALVLSPESIEAYAGLARLDINLGKFEEAQIKITEALEIQPDFPALLTAIPMLRKMTLADNEWLNKILDLSTRSNSVSKQEAISLQFALCKYYDDTKQYDLAFAAATQGNMLKRSITGPFDRAGYSKLVDSIIATYTADVINQLRSGASQSQRPLLIVGMPRSGTSLIEQIIASHPDAAGAGELYFWGDQANTNKAAVKSGQFEPALLQDIASAYEQLLQQYSPKASRIVDKMPQNFLWLGLVCAVFPNARIIHSMRNPVDTCLSIYLHNFNLLHIYATDLDDLAFYYREYLRLMQHWRTVLPPDRFIEMPYESLVEDQLAWSQRLIEFMGLAWDERCLDFHKTERSVGTSSNWQVRQKIYSTSKARWRNYEKHLGPLLANDLNA